MSAPSPAQVCPLNGVADRTGSSDSITRTPIAKSAVLAASSMPCRAERWPYRVVFEMSTVTD